MAESISAFGYSVPLTVVLVFVALVIGLALAVLFWLTIALSTFRAVKQTRRQRVRDDLQGEILERTFDPDADWKGWVDGLSALEREVTESLLDEYLRELDGQERRNLQDLGTALGIPDRSRRQLQHTDEYTRLHALTWLTLLGQPAHLDDFEAVTPRERALVARCRHESPSGAAASELLAGLLAGTGLQFTIFGQDTLYRLATMAPDTFLQEAETASSSWSPALLVQVLTVCQHLGSATAADLSWLVEKTEHDDQTVRAAAVLALGNVGWRDGVRDDRLLRRLIRDSSPSVRSAVYEMLADWGDQHALDTLVDALARETDERAQLAGTNALAEHRHSLDYQTITDWSTAWHWSKTHAAYDSAARTGEAP